MPSPKRSKQRPSRAPKAATRVQPQQERSRRTRERILEAACACFEAEGFEGTTTAKIAKRAGVGISPIYSYFEDKRAILLEILDAKLERMVEETVAALDSTDWTAENFRSRFADLLQYLVKTRPISPRLVRIMWQRIFEDDADFRHMAQHYEDRLIAQLDLLLDKLKREKALRTSPRAATSFVILASADWLVNRLLMDEAPVPPKQVTDAVADMVTAYLLGTD